jgi:hypothetical protein
MYLKPLHLNFKSAPEGIRTPNLLIRSQMLYPLSYRRKLLANLIVSLI